MLHHPASFRVWRAPFGVLMALLCLVALPSPVAAQQFVVDDAGVTDSGRALYGVRADVPIHEHVTLIGEIFGEGQDVGVQLGFGMIAIPELLVFDAGFGEALTGHMPSIGFALGVAWTPPPFFTPLR
jgi:hypothetical protein